MLDVVMKNMIKDAIATTNTTMKCRVISKKPIRIQPIKSIKYLTGDEDYPIIDNPSVVKQWTLHLGDVFPNGDFVTDDTTFSGGEPVSFDLPLEEGDTVLVAFDKNNLADATIIGVI